MTRKTSHFSQGLILPSPSCPRPHFYLSGLRKELIMGEANFIELVQGACWLDT